MTSFMSRFGSAIEHTEPLVMQITVNFMLVWLIFAFAAVTGQFTVQLLRLGRATKLLRNERILL